MEAIANVIRDDSLTDARRLVAGACMKAISGG
jgi:hypothetical protein